MNASVQARKDGLTTDRLSYRQFGTADFGVPQHDSSKLWARLANHIKARGNSGETPIGHARAARSSHNLW